jgi:hypothetical protein
MFETWHNKAGMIQSVLDLRAMVTHYFAIDDFQKRF